LRTKEVRVHFAPACAPWAFPENENKQRGFTGSDTPHAIGRLAQHFALKVQQKLFPQPFQVEELFVEVTRALA
jgi:hypothetical protein